jgi:hypothetical protein
MSERKTSAQSPSASSSGSHSLPDALDSASVHELSSAIHGMRQSIDDSRELVRAEARKGEFRERMMVNAIEKNTVAVKGLAAIVGNAARLNREAVREVTGEFRTHSAELIKQGASMKEQAKALHFWLLLVSIVLGVVGESGVIHEVHWQKLCVGLAMAIGGLAVKYAAAWQSSDVKAQLGDGGGK